MKWQLILRKIAVLFIVFSLFEVLFWPPILPFYITTLLLPFALLFMVMNAFKRKSYKFLILPFAVLFGLTIVHLFRSGDLNVGGILFAVRWLKWPAIFLILNDLNFNTHQVKRIVQYSFLALALMNVLMLMNPFGISESLMLMYSGKAEMVFSYLNETGVMRLTGTQLNPNDNAIIFSLFFFFFLLTESKFRMPFLFLSLTLVILTQSRTALVALLLGVMLYMFIRALRKKRINWLVPIGVMSVLVITYLLFNAQNLSSLFSAEALRSSSWMERVEHYAVIGQMSSLEIVIGAGVIFDPFQELGFYFDSEYLYFLYQYGLVGVMLWLAILISMARFDGVRLEKVLPIYAFTIIIALTNTLWGNPTFATLFLVLIPLLNIIPQQVDK